MVKFDFKGNENFLIAIYLKHQKFFLSVLEEINFNKIFY